MKLTLVVAIRHDQPYVGTGPARRIDFESRHSTFYPPTPPSPDRSEPAAYDDDHGRETANCSPESGVAHAGSLRVQQDPSSRNPWPGRSSTPSMAGERGLDFARYTCS